ncbi:MAG: DUF3179 domain-containing (seleno)protein, partial [Halodesulfurarchaeum sp.]
DTVVVPDIDPGPPRAYPLRILNYHEIVNDRVGDVPIAVTWCPLCGTIVVFDRRVEEVAGDEDGEGEREGETLTFGVSGKLADDNLVMYDRETGSEWKQSLGTCIEGPREGESLSILPVIVTTWERYREFVDEPRVLAETEVESEAASETNEPARIDYDRDPYTRYFESDGFGLAAHRNEDAQRSWERDDLDPKDVVLGIGEEEAAVGVPRPWLLEHGNVTRVALPDRTVVVFGTPSGMYAYEDPGFQFEYREAETFVGGGTEWHAVTGRSQDGRSLKRLPTRREFVFTWQDDHGADSFLSM